MSLSAIPSTVISFARWPVQGREAAWLAELDLPHLRQWLAHAQRVNWPAWPMHPHAEATLTPPHEQVWAQLAAWPLADGGVPTAAHAAVQAGLATPATAQGWAFVSLCYWQVSNGQVTLADPAHLHLSTEEDQVLLAAMHGFFAEDGLTLHPHQPGVWLVQADWLVDVPTASLDRVIGQDVNAWLVGCESPQLSKAAHTLRRLQNEMQMLLYTHPVNDGRRLTINSFWVHGTGALPGDASRSAHQEPAVIQTLRPSALQQDLIGWLEAWQHVDAHVIAPLLARVAAGEPQRLVLCGEHEFHVYDSAAPSLWQRLRTHLAPTSLDTVLAVAPLKD